MPMESSTLPHAPLAVVDFSPHIRHMVFSRQFGRCPSFPAAFNICTEEDLQRPLSRDPVILFFRDNKLKTGHYTLMWSMAKAMLKLAQLPVGTSFETWEGFLKGDRGNEQLNKLMERHIGAGWEQWGP